MIDSKTIEDAVYNLCVKANTTLNNDVFTKISDAYNAEKSLDAKQALGLILKNAKMSYDKKMPLCQDTGQVLVFVEIGNNCCVKNLNESINNAVAKAYEENFYRKSVVQNSVFSRINTKTNTPCIIYTEIVEGNQVQIELLLKGAGCENVSAIEMLSPTANEDEIIQFVTSIVKKAGSKGCPPYFIGVGIGGTIEHAGLLSKKALLLKEDIDENHKQLSDKIKTSINNLEIGAAGLGGNATALDVKLMTDFTHIANMPVAVTINCHSSRHASCIINNQGQLVGECVKEIETDSLLENYVAEKEDFSDFIEVETSDIKKLKSLKQGQKILLSGDIYTARDMAHKKIIEMIEKGEKLPFELENKIIFYAGPCPCEKECIIGSVGPTTASRMDKFAPILYKKGILATIGKGERSDEVKDTIKEAGGLYLTAVGGIACYLSSSIRKNKLLGKPIRKELKQS